MASPSLPQVLGQFGLTEEPTSPHTHADGTKESVTRTFRGTYAQAQAGEPAIGSTFADLPGEVLVVDTDVAKLAGDIGVLTIVLETPYATTYEIEFVEVDKVLIANPRYWCEADGDPQDGPFVLTIADRSMIEKWEQEDDFMLKGPPSLGGPGYCYKVLQGTIVGTTPAPIQTGVAITGYTGMFNLYQLSTNAQDYAKKRLRQQEQYRLYAPVVRETSESLDKPDSSSCGLLQQPPDESGAPDGYVWQKSADRTTRTGPYGKYRRQREWQGAEYIDTDIYGTASPSVADPID
jgi:hypothetical protein